MNQRALIAGLTTGLSAWGPASRALLPLLLRLSRPWAWRPAACRNRSGEP